MLNPVTDAVIARLKDALPGGVRDVEARYLEEPRGRYAGSAGVVVAPSGTEEVAAAIRIAAEASVGVVPYGGGTGLVAGQVLTDGPPPIVLSLERMTRIRDVSDEANVAEVEAGAIIADIQAAAEAKDRLFPLAYAADGSARIGGALAVNSGGLNVLRYGPARDQCLGIEAVLPDGQIYRGLRRLRKDNTGYDLKNLLIGSEGTLGVITAATLKLYPRPSRRATALLAVPSPEAALAVLGLAGQHAGEAISAFELMSGVGFGFFDETGMDLRLPLESTPDWLVLIEIATSGEVDPEAAVEAIYEAGDASGAILDGTIANSEAQRTALWALREGMPEANKRIGAIASHDVSLPLSAIPHFIDEAARRLRAKAPVRINAFGHLGDGNLHYNLFPPEGAGREDFAPMASDLTRIVHDLTAEMDGSFSAEHGVGRLKVEDLERYGDPVKLEMMRRIKGVIDPLGIMNPGAVLRGR